MTVRRKSEIAVCEAIQRLVSGQPIRAENCMLVDLNLAIEAGVSRATMYRSEAMQDWRKAKESAVRRAIIVLKHRAVDNPSLVLTDADLVREAMVERAALREFPKFQAEWQAVKDNQMCQLSIERSDPDRVITSLVSTIYGLALALRRKYEIIQVQAKQLEIGSGKIAAFPPRRL